MPTGKIWTQSDRFGNDIYLTHERWAHIIDSDNHPEVAPFFDYLAKTIRLGRRQQDRYDPQGYRYAHAFADLPDNNSHLVVCVRFRWHTHPDDTITIEKFITTAYFQAFKE